MASEVVHLRPQLHVFIAECDKFGVFDIGVVRRGREMGERLFGRSFREWGSKRVVNVVGGRVMGNLVVSTVKTREMMRIRAKTRETTRIRATLKKGTRIRATLKKGMRIRATLKKGKRGSMNSFRRRRPGTMIVRTIAGKHVRIVISECRRSEFGWERHSNKTSREKERRDDGGET